MRQPATYLWCAALAGCAFFGKSEPLSPAYYSAEPAPEAAPAGPVASSTGDAFRPSVRLHRVDGAGHLRERIAYRTGPRELGFYETRRWAERPEVYLRRALARALFEQRGLVHAVSGGAPSLDVELFEFDEWRGPPHRVRVAAYVVLSEGRRVRFEHSISAEQAVSSDADEGQFADVAEAFSVALGRVVDEIGDRVVAELRAPSPSEAPAPPPQ